MIGMTKIPNPLLEAYLRKSGYKFRNKNLKTPIMNTWNSSDKSTNEPNEITSHQSHVIPEPR
jgi:hypothetical protein